MKRTYQIEKRKAIQRLRLPLTSDPGKIQLILAMSRYRRAAAKRRRSYVEAELQLLELIMADEVNWLTGARYGRCDNRALERWGTSTVNRLSWHARVYLPSIWVLCQGNHETTGLTLPGLIADRGTPGAGNA